jgi:hypothetical protein
MCAHAVAVPGTSPDGQPPHHPARRPPLVEVLPERCLPLLPADVGSAAQLALDRGLAVDRLLGWPAPAGFAGEPLGALPAVEVAEPEVPSPAKLSQTCHLDHPASWAKKLISTTF